MLLFSCATGYQILAEPNPTDTLDTNSFYQEDSGEITQSITKTDSIQMNQDYQNLDSRIYSIESRLEEVKEDNQSNLIWWLIKAVLTVVVLGLIVKLVYDEISKHLLRRSYKKYLFASISKLANSCSHQIENNQQFIDVLEDLKSKRFNLDVTIGLSSNVLEIIPQDEIYKMYLRNYLNFTDDDDAMTFFSFIELAKVTYNDLEQELRHFLGLEITNNAEFDNYKKMIIDYRKFIPQVPLNEFDKDLITLHRSYANAQDHTYPDITMEKLVMPLIDLCIEHDHRTLLIAIEGCINTFNNFKSHRLNTKDHVKSLSDKLNKLKDYFEGYCKTN